MSAAKQLLKRAWKRVQEPRALSVIYFCAYMAVFVLGLAVVIDPPRTVQSSLGLGLVICWAWMLIVGGGIGLCTALQGVWWMERGGAVLCMFGMGIYAIAIAAQPVTQPSLRLASLCYVAFSILAFAARLVDTRLAAYDPER